MYFVLDSRTATNHFPGIGRYVYNLARAMVPQLVAHEKLVLLYNPKESTRWDLRQLTGSQVEVIEVGISPFSLRQQWQIPDLLKKLNAAVYHSPYYIMPYRPGIPTLLTVYDMIPLRYPQYVSRQARLLYRLTHRLALRTAAHIITISHTTAADLRHFFNVSDTKVSTIHLAADPAYTPQSPEAIAELRAQLALPVRYVLYLGSNKPHKNLVRLIQAWAQVDAPDTILVIAGVWDDRYPEAKRVARQLNLDQRVKFLGPIPEKNLPALYSGAVAFVFPSEYEGFGLPVLEAMACGVPVVCANTSSLPEIAGNAALLFEPTDVDSVTEALCRLLSDADLRADFGDRSLRHTSQFLWGQTAQKTIALYRYLSPAHSKN